MTSDTNMEYHMRVDTDFKDDYIVAFFTPERVAKYIISRELKKDSGKVHIHAYIFLNLKVTTFRSQVAKYFRVKGIDYSVSKKRSKTLGSYVVKDGDIIGYKGFSKEQMEGYIKESFQKKTATIRHGGIMAQLIPEFQKQWDGGLLNCEKIQKFIYNYYTTQYKIFPSDFKMNDMMWTLMAMLLYYDSSNEAHSKARYEKLISYKVERNLGGQEFVLEF